MNKYLSNRSHSWALIPSRLAYILITQVILSHGNDSNIAPHRLEKKKGLFMSIGVLMFILLLVLADRAIAAPSHPPHANQKSSTGHAPPSRAARCTKMSRHLASMARKKKPAQWCKSRDLAKYKRLCGAVTVAGALNLGACVGGSNHGATPNSNGSLGGTTLNNGGGLKSNTKPIADAGDDQSTEIHRAVTLSGKASMDPNGDKLTYRWTLLSKPNTSAASLDSDASGESVSFIPDTAGDYTFRLIVSDGKLESDPATVSVTGLAPVVLAPVSGQTITTIEVSSTVTDGSSQSNVPITFGQVFKEGDVPSGKTIAGRLSDGTPIRLQADHKAAHNDGSLRHAVITAILPTLTSTNPQTVELVLADSAESGAGPTVSDLLKTNFDTSVTLTLGGETYSTSAKALLQNAAVSLWLDGPLVKEWHVATPLKKADGTAHPHLTARFYVRAFTGLTAARVSVIVENNWTFTPSPQNFSYDLSVRVGGKEVESVTPVTHYHHARWYREYWWNTAPSVSLRHSTSYLIATKSIPNYDQSLTVPSAALTATENESNKSVSEQGYMHIGLALAYMPTTGGRSDIGPIPQWTAQYLLSMDPRAKRAMLSTAQGSGSWPIHFRDESTGYPIRLDQDTDRDPNPAVTNKHITLHSNFDSRGPLPVPRCANNDSSLCATPYAPDTAHQPALTYVPYLVTGDYFYLEELQFWAAWNPLGTGAEYHGYEKGLLSWDQVRAQAWSLRTLGETAFITPDEHPLKNYFVQQLEFNYIDYRDNNLTNPNANKLGWLRSGNNMEAVAPWMDDFFTWVTGHLVELGFSSYKPLLNWKALFPVGRMTAPGYCWIHGSVYQMKTGNNATGEVFENFAKIYTETVDPTIASLPCAGAEMAQKLGLRVGEMVGYSASATGFPSNMQPALAAAVDSRISKAAEAWTTFQARSVKPDYASDPQWAILPR